MKTVCFCCLLAAALLAWPACSGNDDAECDTDLALDAVQPSANPPGYEVLLVGEGFTTNTTVRFDNEESPDVTFVSATELIAKIPAGLLGSVEVTVEEGDCVGRNTAFEVFGNFPPGVPVSPVNIVIPQPATSFTSSIQNAWPNLNDPDHTIFLDPVEGDNNGTLKLSSSEYHISNSLLNNNPVSGHFRWNQTTKTSDIRITIDRTAKGGEVEVYDGQLILPNSVGSNAEAVLLLTSQTDGRQLLFEHPG